MDERCSGLGTGAGASELQSLGPTVAATPGWLWVGEGQAGGDGLTPPPHTLMQGLGVLCTPPLTQQAVPHIPYPKS